MLPDNPTIHGWKFSFQNNHLVGRMLIREKNSRLEQDSNPGLQLYALAL